MARLTDLPVDRLDAEQRALYDGIVNGRRAQRRPRQADPGGAGGGEGPGQGNGPRLSLTTPDGGLVGPFGAYLRSPLVGSKLAEAGEAVRFDTGLPQNLLELAVITVARHWTAQFEWYAHSRLALAAGVSPDVVTAIAERRPPAFDDPAEALVHRFAGQLLDDHRVDDETYREAVLRLGERGVVELTAVIGYYCLVSAVLNTFEVPLPAGATPLPA